MEPIYLADLASRQAHWLSVRQATIAGNISHADTPGYRARDVEPFQDILDKTRLTVVASRANHLTDSGSELGARTRSDRDAWAVTPSGNSVTVEEEMTRASEVSGQFRLNRAVVSSFNKLLMLGLRGMR